MKRILRLLVLGGSLVIWTVSCTGININTPVPSLAPDIPPQWWNSWLTEPVCQPPCWQNIKPGVTTIHEAVTILENIPGVIIIYNGKYGLTWDFGTQTGEGNISRTEDGVVYRIWLANSLKSQSLYLKEIVSSYGFPEYVKPADCREGMCIAVLVYPDIGMFLSIFITNNGTTSDPQIEVSPDTVVDRVYFIERGIENFQKIPDYQNYDLLMEWKGYVEYP